MDFNQINLNYDSKFGIKYFYILKSEIKCRYNSFVSNIKALKRFVNLKKKTSCPCCKEMRW